MTLRSRTSLRIIPMIEHTFTLDWRRLAAPLALTLIVMAVAASVAFSELS